MQKVRRFSLIELLTVVALMAALAANAFAGSETQYKAATDGSGAKVAFSPNNGQTIVTAIAADSDVASATLKFYVRSGKKVAPSVAPGATPTQITCTAGGGITNSDVVAYCYNTGAVDIRTVSTQVGGTNITFSAALSGTGTVKDYMYLLAQGGQMQIGTATGTNFTNDGSHSAKSLAGGNLFATPSDSPLYAVLSCTTNNATLMLTVDKP